MLKLAIDFDGCMTNSVKSCSDAGKEFFGRRGISIIPDGSKYEFDELLGISGRDLDDFLEYFYPRYYSDPRLEAGCVSALRELRLLSLPMEIVTSRKPEKVYAGKTVEAYTYEVLERAGLSWLHVNFVESKGEFCQRNGFTHLLDDYTPNMADAIRHSIVPIAFTREHNKDFLVERVNSWAEFRQKLVAMIEYRMSRTYDSPRRVACNG